MKTSVGVFFGGRSVEHEISVISALQAIHAFNRDKYDITPVYISKQGVWYTGDKLLETENYRDMAALVRSLTPVFLKPHYGDHNLYREKRGLFGGDRVVKKLDVIVPVLHGTNGEDGIFQGMIEMTGIPYAGCNPLSSANGMDKIAMKMIMRESGIPTVDYVWFTDKEWGMKREELVERVEKRLGYPVIVKPGNLGSSVGISRAVDRESLLAAVATAQRYSSRLLVEKMVERLKEINCSVLGNYYECEASVCEAPIRSGEILSYEDKYLGGGAKGGAKGGVKESRGMHSTVREIPARLPEEQTAFIRATAVETFKALNCDGVSRIDFMIDEATQQIFVNEINTIPGSLSFYLWEATGISFTELTQRLIDIAFQRKRDSSFKTTSYKENIFNYSISGAKGAKGAKR